MFSSLFMPLLAAATLHAADPAPPPPAGETLALAPLLDAVVERNPNLAALDADRAAALDRAVAAGSMPHPVLGFAVRNVPTDSFSFSADMMTMKEVMLRQQFPWFGKRALRREAVQQNAAVAEAERAAQALALQQATAEAYANLWLATESVALVQEQERALQRFTRIVRGRYAAGGGSQSDLLRADVELVRIREPLLDLDAARSTSRAALATLLASPIRELQGTPEAPPLPPLPADPEALFAHVQAHPELRVLDEQAEGREIEARLAERDRWPDPEIGLSYGQRNDQNGMEVPDMIGAEIMIRIPVFASSKEDRLAAAARSEARATRSRREGRANELLGEARGAYAAARQQQELMRLYDEEILPRARRNLESATGSYQAGSVDFLTLLDAQVQLQTQQLEALRARANYVRHVARLSRATGVSLFRNANAAAEVTRG